MYHKSTKCIPTLVKTQADPANMDQMRENNRTSGIALHVPRACAENHATSAPGGHGSSDWQGCQSAPALTHCFRTEPVSYLVHIGLKCWSNSLNSKEFREFQASNKYRRRTRQQPASQMISFTSSLDLMTFSTDVKEKWWGNGMGHFSKCQVDSLVPTWHCWLNLTLHFFFWCCCFLCSVN